jgi:heterodisulfide reductase subunit A-like polyferredoxin
MPAYQNEIDAAVKEGVIIRCLAAPVRITGDDEDQVTGIEAIRMRPGEPDASGRRRPVPIAGSEFHIECNMVIPAIGQQPERDFPGPRSPLDTAANGTIIADPGTGATSLDGVFAGGDAVTGPATAIEAIAAANRAAEAIHHYLETGNAKINENVQPPIARPEPAELEKLEKTPRVPGRELPTPHRRYSFAEVEFGYSQETAAQEAQRCLNCAGCSDCLECVRVCQAHAVDHQLEDEILNLQVGAVVAATGFDAMDTSILEEYGAHQLANVVTGMQFERLLSASGPTGGHVLRPSDRRAPKKIAFIQCVGSRDMRHHVYCSSVCCMHATKEAILANEHDRETRSTIFYTDLRAAGKTFQEYVARARDEYHVSYIRSRPAFLEEDEETGDVRVIYEDTASRRRKTEMFDMAVLCQALVPSGANALASTLGVELNDLGFIRIPDPLTAPVDTSRGGVLAVGFASAPQDIPDSVVQASAAAGRVAELLEDKTDE